MAVAFCWVPRNGVRYKGDMCRFFVERMEGVYPLFHGRLLNACMSQHSVTVQFRFCMLAGRAREGRCVLRSAL